ncbi:MAG: ankyrin repeat domain-containing protein [Alphaproteobacteria bacterium]
MYKKRNRLGHEQRSFNKASRKTNPVPKEEGYAFLRAAEKGDFAGVKTFVEKYGRTGIDMRDRDWSPKNEALWKTDQGTALWQAASEGHQEIVEYLIAQGADVNAPDKYGYTPLMVSCKEGLAGLLLDAGAKIEQKDNHGGTVLMWPLRAGMITFLVSRGANMEARDEDGKTALIRVAEGHYARGHATAEGNMEELIKAGADINAQDDKGRTALMNAASRAAFEEESLNIVEFLLKHNANPHVKDKQGNTAAMLALGPLEPMEPGKVDIARLAMEKADEKLQKRLGALLNHTCTDQLDKIDKAFVEKGTAEKVGVMKPLQLRK